MSKMDKPTLNFLIHNGTTAIEQGNTLMALLFFEDAALQARTPAVISSLGYCVAAEHRQIQKGISFCLEALQKEPTNALHYLNLGRIYLLARQKPLAFQTFRKGLKYDRERLLIREMKKLGVRREPVFRSLERRNPLNRYVGLLFDRIGLR